MALIADEHALARWYRDLAPGAYEALEQAERAEPWIRAAEPVLRKSLGRLDDALEAADESAFVRLLESPSGRGALKRVLGYLSFRRRVRVVEWILTRMGFRDGVRLASALFATSDEGESGAAGRVLRGTLVYLRRRRLLAELFSRERVWRVVEAALMGRSGPGGGVA